MNLLYPLILFLSLSPPFAQAKEASATKALRAALRDKANEDAVNGACFQGDGEEIDPSGLRGEAKKAYGKSLKEAAKAESSDPDVLSFELGAFTAVMVDNTIEGNGCCRYFTVKGAHLGDYCGTESSDWTWQ